MFASERLAREHVLDGFSSGEETLDRWLQRSALVEAQRGYVNTYVWTDGGYPVLAYYSLAGHAVDRDAAPSRVGRGGPDRIPAILLAKLALDKSLHGQGLGTELLLDALWRCAGAADVGPSARIVVVDALHDRAASFYAKFGFRPLGRDTPLRLYRKMSDICSDLFD